MLVLGGRGTHSYMVSGQGYRPRPRHRPRHARAKLASWTLSCAKNCALASWKSWGNWAAAAQQCPLSYFKRLVHAQPLFYAICSTAGGFALSHRQPDRIDPSSTSSAGPPHASPLPSTAGSPASENHVCLAVQNTHSLCFPCTKAGATESVWRLTRRIKRRGEEMHKKP
jgi:hypothetical protein